MGKQGWDSRPPHRLALGALFLGSLGPGTTSSPPATPHCPPCEPDPLAPLPSPEPKRWKGLGVFAPFQLPHLSPQGSGRGAGHQVASEHHSLPDPTAQFPGLFSGSTWPPWPPGACYRNLLSPSHWLLRCLRSPRSAHSFFLRPTYHNSSPDPEFSFHDGKAVTRNQRETWRSSEKRDQKVPGFKQRKQRPWDDTTG